jgi:hypothetical protein
MSGASPLPGTHGNLGSLAELESHAITVSLEIQEMHGSQGTLESLATSATMKLHVSNAPLGSLWFRTGVLQLPTIASTTHLSTATTARTTIVPPRNCSADPRKRRGTRERTRLRPVPREIPLGTRQGMRRGRVSRSSHFPATVDLVFEAARAAAEAARETATAMDQGRLHPQHRLRRAALRNLPSTQNVQGYLPESSRTCSSPIGPRRLLATGVPPQADLPAKTHGAGTHRVATSPLAVTSVSISSPLLRIAIGRARMAAHSFPVTVAHQSARHTATTRLFYRLESDKGIAKATGPRVMDREIASLVLALGPHRRPDTRLTRTIAV